MPSVNFRMHSSRATLSDNSHKKKIEHAVTITTNILFMCLLPCSGSNGTTGYFDCRKSTFSPLKGQRLCYRFSQKHGSDLTSLQDLSTPCLSHIFLSNCIVASMNPNEDSKIGIHTFLQQKEKNFFYLIETVGRNKFRKPNRISCLGFKPRYWTMFLPSS